MRQRRFVGETRTVFANYDIRFHMTTAYGILRMKGVDVGKFDFLNGAKEIVIEKGEEQK